MRRVKAKRAHEPQGATTAQETQSKSETLIDSLKSIEDRGKLIQIRAFTINRDLFGVTVPDAGDPEGSECVSDVVIRIHQQQTYTLNVLEDIIRKVGT